MWVTPARASSTDASDSEGGHAPSHFGSRRFHAVGWIGWAQFTEPLPLARALRDDPLVRAASMRASPAYPGSTAEDYARMPPGGPVPLKRALRLAGR